MFFGLLTLFVALAISTVYVLFYCWVMAIFAGATIAIAIMGVVLEVGKLVVASWTFSKLENDCIHDEGVFHLCSSGVDVHNIIRNIWVSFTGTYSTIKPTALLEERIERIEIKTEQKQEQIGRYEGRLEILNNALERYIELGAVTRGLNKIAESDNETTLLKSRIDTLEGEIDDLTDEKYELKTKLNLAEVEVGPIRYIAEMLYDDASESELEEAVRWIIILLIFVFDPLAVVLVIAANIHFERL